MPRKKTRSRVPGPKQLKPGLKITEDMDENVKQEQLTLFLQDFDFQVKQRKRELSVKSEQKKQNIRSNMATFLRTFPESALNKTLCFTEEFVDTLLRGGSDEKQSNDTINKNDIRQQIEDDLGGSLSRLISARAFPMSSIKEEGESCMPEEMQDSVSKQSKAKKQVAPPQPPPDTSVRRSSRARKGKYATPAAGGKDFGGFTPMLTPQVDTTRYGASTAVGRDFVGFTPMITPKFDTTRPTPHTARVMRPGESLMSVKGSPVQVSRLAAMRSESSLHEVRDKWASEAGIDLSPSKVEVMLRVVYNH